jgi:hypothetical protein
LGRGWDSSPAATGRWSGSWLWRCCPGRWPCSTVAGVRGVQPFRGCRGEERAHLTSLTTLPALPEARL